MCNFWSGKLSFKSLVKVQNQIVPVKCSNVWVRWWNRKDRPLMMINYIHEFNLGKSLKQLFTRTVWWQKFLMFRVMGQEFLRAMSVLMKMACCTKNEQYLQIKSWRVNVFTDIQGFDKNTWLEEADKSLLVTVSRTSHFNPIRTRLKCFWGWIADEFFHRSEYYSSISIHHSYLYFTGWWMVVIEESKNQFLWKNSTKYNSKENLSILKKMSSHGFKDS